MIRTDLTAPHLAGVAARGCAGEVLGRPGPARETVSDYTAVGGYPALPEPAAIRSAADDARLRGAGGAGFPMARKLDAVAAAPGPRVVVGNAEEGEPASAKDRWLARHRPHLVLDGLRCAARAVQADRLVFYTSDPVAADAIRAAQREAAPAAREPGVADVQVFEVEPAYVAGEETAVVRAIDGDEAKPLAKPPRPYQTGVDGRPTLVSNVESLARLALAVRGSAAAGATLLLTVTCGERAELTEVPVGTTVREALAPVTGGRAPRALLLGGFAGGIWRPDQVMDAALTHDGLRERGALLGCGALVAIDDGDCPLAAAADVLGYLAASSSGQCGICVRGTPASAELLRQICRGTGTADTVALLARRAAALVGRGNCAMPDAAAQLIQTLLASFPDEVAAHLGSGCGVCAETVGETTTQTRFRVKLPA